MRAAGRATGRRLHWLIFASIVVLSAAGTLGAQTPQWKTYSYAGDGFSASFPAEPTMQKQAVPVGSNSFELRFYLAEDKSAGVMIGVCEFGSLVAGADPDAMLQGGKTTALENTKTHLLREKSISLGANHGLEFEAENEAFHVTSRLYIVGTVLYEEIVAYPVKEPYAQTQQFLDSFQLIAKTDK